MPAEIWIKWLLILSVLLLLLLFSYHWVRFRRNSLIYLERVDYFSLGANQSLQLFKLGEDKLILLAVSPQNVQCLSELPQTELKPLPQPPESAIRQDSPRLTELKSFLKRLTQRKHW